MPVSQSYNDPIHYNREGRIVLSGEWVGEYKPEPTRWNFAAEMDKVRDFKAGDMTIALKMDAVEGTPVFKNKELEQTISMNKPCIFPNTWYGGLTGVCYKFSQASHHIIPGDPKNSDPTYSGVQVLRDPGWLFKWVGCMMICFGIFTMFYLRPYFTYRPKVAPPVEDEPDVKKRKKKNK